MSLSRFGLYYPDICPSGEWLLMAALYWPKLARIVPAGVDPDRDPDARVLRDELDFFVDVAPEPAAAKVSARMLALLARHGRELVHRYRLDLAEVRAIEPGDFDGSYRVRTGRGVHETKIGSEVLQVLASQRLAVRDNELVPWLLMDDRLAEVYLCALAEQVAADNALAPVTDSITHYLGASGWTLDRLTRVLLAPGGPLAPPGPGEVPAALGMLALRLVVPAGPGGELDRVPVAAVVELRRRHGAQFVAFRAEVEAIAAEVATELAGVDDPAVLDGYLSDLARTRLVQPMADLRRAVTGLGLTAASHALTMKFEVPALATLAAGGALAERPVVAGGAALAAGLVSLYQATRQERAELVAPSAASYLLAVYGGFHQARGSVDQVLAGFRRIADRIRPGRPDTR